MGWVCSWDTGGKDYIRNFDTKTLWKRVLGRTWDWRGTCIGEIRLQSG